MKPSDYSTITAVAVLAAALYAFLSGLGVDVPMAVPAAVPLVAGAVIFALRVYVAFVGPDKTQVDERLATAEALVASASTLLASVRTFPPEAPTRKEGKP